MSSMLPVLVPEDRVPLRPEDLKARLDLIVAVMRTVMKVDEDFGKIPGTDKPTLYKPGAEKLLVTFRLCAGKPAIEDHSDSSDVIRYRVEVPILTMSGICVAVGIGECSSGEEKYRWRKPVWKSKEWEETAEDRRREVWKSGRDSAYKLRQVRTNPTDVANTILKMAHKRGLIHGTLLATAASSAFEQDLEDIPEETRREWADQRQEMNKPDIQPPQRKAPTGNGGAFIDSKQQKALIDAGKAAGWTPEALAAWIGEQYGAWDKVPVGDYSTVMTVMEVGTSEKTGGAK